MMVLICESISIFAFALLSVAINEATRAGIPFWDRLREGSVVYPKAARGYCSNTSVDITALLNHGTAISLFHGLLGTL